MARSIPTSDDVARWRQRPLFAGVVRAVALLSPLLLGVAAGILLGHALPRPPNVALLLVYLAATTATTMGVAWLVDRAARRLLPLAALLNLSLLFPDRAPSRYSVALRSGSVRRLERQVSLAKSQGIGGTEVEAAETVIQLASSLNAHDRLTRGHAERVRAYANLLADELRLSPTDRDRLHWAALLHDIGKLFVHPHILNKDGKPTPEEWEVLRRHPEEGAALVEPLRGWLGRWSAAIAEHHEAFDGSGYPKGLAGTEISLGARIVAVADAYDVMTSHRSYKAPMSTEAARSELARCAGRQFDPEVVRAFLNIGLGRLRWAMGPLSSLFELPLLTRVEGLAPQLGVAARAVVALVAFGVAGMATTHAPQSLLRTAPAAVVAQDDYRPLPDALFQPKVDPGPAEAAADPEPATVPVVSASPAPAGEAPASGPNPSPPAQDPRSTPVARGGSPAHELRVSGLQDTPVSVDLLAALGGPANVDPSSIRIISAGAHGAVTVDAGTGRVTYVPDGDFAGTDVVRYRACSPAGVCGDADLLVAMAAVDHPPVAQADTVTMSEDGGAVLVDVLANDRDADGPLDLDRSSLALVNPPALGTAAIVGGSIRYVPAPDRNGADEFTYRICDVAGICAIGAVDVAISAVEDPPSFEAVGTVTASEDAGPVRVIAAVTGVTGGPFDEAGEPVSFTTSVDDPTLFSQLPVISGDGSLSFESAANRWGSTVVTVLATDAGGLSVSATLSLSVTPVNDAPVAGGDVVSTAEDTPVTVAVLANDVDVDGDVLSVSGATGPVQVNGDGTVMYSPPTDFNGSASFSYTVSDGRGGTATGTVNVSVTPVNDVPSFAAAGDVAMVAAPGGGFSSPSWAFAISPGGGADEAGQGVTFDLTVPTASAGLFQTSPTVDLSGTLAFTSSGATGTAAVTVVAVDTAGARSNPVIFTVSLTPTLVPHVVISEYRTSGPGGNLDDFVELYNPTGAPVDVSGYTLADSKDDGKPNGTTVVPPSTVLPYGGHLLLAGADYTGAAPPDIALSKHLTNAAGVGLLDGSGNLVDAVGADSAPAVAGAAFREGAGLPAMSTGVDQSYERRAGGGAGSCIDTDDNASDFLHDLRPGSPNPQDLASPLTPCAGVPAALSSPLTHLVISEARDDGPAGDADEFIELFNPTTSSVSLVGWTVDAVSGGGGAATVFQFTGPLAALPPGAHLLLGGAASSTNRYGGSVVPDAWYGSGAPLQTIGIALGPVVNTSGTVLLRDVLGNLVDAVGFGAVTTAEGTPLPRRTGGSPDSYERGPGGAAGSCVDTDDNMADFVHRFSPGPQNLASSLTRCG